jgi:hypothetical protein
MLQGIYDSAARGDWVREDEDECGCRGGGWFLSDVDTWHKCPVHALNARHPEDQPEPTDNMDGDHDTSMRDAGMGTDEDYGYYPSGEDW